VQRLGYSVGEHKTCMQGVTTPLPVLPWQIKPVPSKQTTLLSFRSLSHSWQTSKIRIECIVVKSTCG
jgi:hypothetical protein